jgi:hypothetical protein
MSVDEPVEVDAVVADDAMVERLRSALSPEDAVVWDDHDDEDASYALLRALQRDVSADVDLPVLSPTEDVPLVAPRRRLGRTATVAVVAAGVLSVAGAAAAATSSPGSPIYGVRSAVASAVHDAIDAVSPAKPDAPASSAPAVPTPVAAPTPPGSQVSTAARSASAAVQIEERLGLAARLVEEGRGTPALAVLDQAERRLPLVADLAARAAFQQRIDALRAQAEALVAPHGKPTASPNGGQSASHKPTPKPKPSHSAAPNRSDGTPGPAARPSHPAQPSAKPSLPARPSLPNPQRSRQNS